MFLYGVVWVSLSPASRHNAIGGLVTHIPQTPLATTSIIEYHWYSDDDFVEGVRHTKGEEWADGK
jgi:hypothetical protein